MSVYTTTINRAAINIPVLISLLSATGILFPFALSFRRNLNLKTKVLSFFILPILEVLLFVGAFIKADSFEDIAQYSTLGDRYDRVFSLFIAIVMLLVLSSTLAYVLVDNMPYRLRYVIKALTLPVIGSIAVFCVFILLNS